jgi:hypothetical protein
MAIRSSGFFIGSVLHGVSNNNRSWGCGNPEQEVGGGLNRVDAVVSGIFRPGDGAADKGGIGSEGWNRLAHEILDSVGNSVVVVVLVGGLSSGIDRGPSGKIRRSHDSGHRVGQRGGSDDECPCPPCCGKGCRVRKIRAVELEQRIGLPDFVPNEVEGDGASVIIERAADGDEIGGVVG